MPILQPGAPQQQRLYEDFARLPRGGLATAGSGTGIPARPPYAPGMAPPSLSSLSQVRNSSVDHPPRHLPDTLLCLRLLLLLLATTFRWSYPIQYPGHEDMVG